MKIIEKLCAKIKGDGRKKIPKVIMQLSDKQIQKIKDQYLTEIEAKYKKLLGMSNKEFKFFMVEELQKVIK